MYKLIAKLPSGARWISCSDKATDLQRIAINLGSQAFQITHRMTGIVYTQGPAGYLQG